MRNARRRLGLPIARWGETSAGKRLEERGDWERSPRASESTIETKKERRLGPRAAFFTSSSTTSITKPTPGYQ